MQFLTKFEVMVLKLGDYMTEVFTYLYDDLTENSFFQTSRTDAIRDLRTNDTCKQIDFVSTIKFSR